MFVGDPVVVVVVGTLVAVSLFLILSVSLSSRLTLSDDEPILVLSKGISTLSSGGSSL